MIYLSPQGRKLDQGGVTELAQNQKLILVCGRYEGIDERLIQTEIDEEWSIWRLRSDRLGNCRQ